MHCTKKDELLLLMTYSGSGMRKKLAEELYGRYGAKVIDEFIADKLVTTKKTKPRIVVLTQKGYEYIKGSEYSFSAMVMLDNNEGGRKRFNTSTKGDANRISGISDIIASCRLAGVNTYIEERGVTNDWENEEIAFYTSRELKVFIDSKSQFASGSYCHGSLKIKDNIYHMYHLENEDISFVREVEKNYKEAVAKEMNIKKSGIIVFDFGYAGIEKILQNDYIEKLKEKKYYGVTAPVTNRITSTIDYDSKYYVPSGKEGTIYLKAIINESDTKGLIKYISSENRISTGGISGLGYSEEDREIVNMFPINMATMSRLNKSKNKYSVIALESAVPELKKIYSNVDIKWITIPDEQLIDYFEEE